MEVIQLQKEHYAQLIELLNHVFTLQNKREMDFEKELPKMCVADDMHMQKHYGIFDGEKLVAALGAYPLKAKVLDEELLVYTVGNIATHPDYEGKGYMSAMLSKAMQELEYNHADISRLGGIRQRYQRFGYENGGAMYEFKLTSDNVARVFKDELDKVVFEKIERNDVEKLELANKLLTREKFYVDRKTDDGYFGIYTSMIAWRNQPYLAKIGDKVLGYLCVSPNGNNIAECFAYEKETMMKMLCAWQKQVGATISFRFQPHQVEYIQGMSGICQSINVSIPSQFKILNWEKVIRAFIKLKASYTAIPKGILTIHIEGYGGLKLFVDEDIGCERYDGECAISLTALDATRYLFGPLPPETVGKANAIASAWLPLPLSWNLQDRV